MVFIADVNEERLAYCEKEFDFAATINCMGDVKAELDTLTDGDYPTVIIDATGNSRAMEGSFQWLAHAGTLVFVSVVKSDITFNDPEFLIIFHFNKVPLTYLLSDIHSPGAGCGISG